MKDPAQLVLVASLLLAGCASAADDASAPVSEDQAEIALYAAIQEDAVTVRRGSADRGRPALDALYDITCRRTQLGVWDCRVLLSDGSTVVCTVDRIETVGEDVAVEGQPRCKY